MVYRCVKCTNFYLIENDFVYEIKCGKCKLQTCGKCLRRPHYPALCHEFERWAFRHQERNAFIIQRFIQYGPHWNQLNSALVFLNNVQTAYEQTSPESYQRFHKCLILPFNQMREIVDFDRWFRLHAAFNPVVKVALANEYNVLQTRMHTFFYFIPPPGFAANFWKLRIVTIDRISIDLGVAVANLISAIPNARNLAEVEDAKKAVHHWHSKMVS